MERILGESARLDDITIPKHEQLLGTAIINSHTRGVGF